VVEVVLEVLVVVRLEEQVVIMVLVEVEAEPR
jgi:hypothetical protein